jgi:hypothetical protein
MRDRTRCEVVEVVQPMLEEGIIEAARQATARLSEQVLVTAGGQPVIIQNLNVTINLANNVRSSGGGATVRVG